VSGDGRVKTIKIRLRLARLSNGWILDRDMVRAPNIGLRALSSDGKDMVFSSFIASISSSLLCYSSGGPMISLAIFHVHALPRTF